VARRAPELLTLQKDDHEIRSVCAALDRAEGLPPPLSPRARRGLALLTVGLVDVLRGDAGFGLTRLAAVVVCPPEEQRAVAEVLGGAEVGPPRQPSLPRAPRAPG
jgi:hypothetical protein